MGLCLGSTGCQPVVFGSLPNTIFAGKLPALRRIAEALPHSLNARDA